MPYQMKIKLYQLLLMAIVFGRTGQGQTLRRPITAPYMGLGAYSFAHADVFSFTANQASLAQLKNFAVGIYSERRFFLSELNDCTVVAGAPTRSGNFGLKAAYSGFGDYNETQLGLACARRLGAKADLGIQFNYNGVRIAGYGSAAAISFEMGFIFHVNDKLHTGFHINNPVGGKFGKDRQEKLPSVYTTGFGYDASEKFFFSIELIKEEDQPVGAEAGFQYRFIPQLLIKAGLSSATSSCWIGLGLPLKSLRFDIITSYHPQLGITPGLLLLYKSPTSKKE